MCVTSAILPTIASKCEFSLEIIRPSLEHDLPFMSFIYVFLLTVEIFKVLNGIASDFLNSFFAPKSIKCDLRDSNLKPILFSTNFASRYVFLWQ